MAPPLPPPELPDDAVAEIVLRLPPDEPRCLFRASLVCKSWHRLLTDASFLRRYRRFHKTPPLLGYFFIDFLEENIPRFIPTTPASPFPKPMFDCRPWISLDCRHGRVLLHKKQEHYFTVWDPITGCREDVHEPLIPLTPFSVAVLCAVDGCDHRDCHGGPFLVVWVWAGGPKQRAFALVYSSQVGSWVIEPACVEGLGVGCYIYPSHGTLVGGDIYFTLQMGDRILKYDLVKHRLSVIDPPELYNNAMLIMPTEDALLGVAGTRGSTLYLWSRKANAEGVEGWVQYRVIELRTLLPDNHFEIAVVVGFAEGVRVIVVLTEIGNFTIDLNSEQARKVSEPGTQYAVVPFMSFYTSDCACGKFPLPAETN